MSPRFRSLVSASSALLLATIVTATAADRKKGSEPAFDPALPILGSQLGELPGGPGKVIADRACLKCHAPDMLRQQRLTEKQWAANLTKMIGWGADVKEAEKDELVSYLVKSFGPDNDRFQPVVTRPVGK